MKKLFKILYGVFFVVIIVIAFGVIVPLLPIPGNYKLLTVLSGSMSPAIQTGSMVVIKPEGDYKIGDVITFGKATKLHEPTTHRINDIKNIGGQPVYITKGDANNAPDQKEIPKKEVIGKVLFSIPFIGYAINFAKKPFGFMLIIIVPAVIIIGDEIRKIGKEIHRIKRVRGKKKESEGDGGKEKEGEK